MGMGTVAVYGSGNRLLVNIPASVILSENLKRGDLVDIIVKNTGMKSKRRPYAFKPKDPNAPDPIKPTEPVQTPEIKSNPKATPITYDTIPEEVVAQITASIKKESWKTVIPLAAKTLGDYTEEELLSNPEIAAVIKAQDAYATRKGGQAQ